MRHFQSISPVLSGLFLSAVLATACGSNHQTAPDVTNGCLDKMQSNIQAIDAQQPDIRPGNESVVLKGDPKRVVFLLHGFIASPAEVQNLGNALQARGYTVVMPLLAGFGRTTDDADNTTSDQWLKTTQQQLDASASCGGKVQVVGFSLGALVETKLLVEHPQMQDKVASLTLVSPALSIRNDSMMNIGAALFRLVNTNPRVSFLASVARKFGNQDLNIPEANPNFYNDELPMRVVKNLGNLAKSIDFTLFANFGPPVKIIYSEDDHTVDGAAAFNSIATFHSNTTETVIAADKNVPHQILMTNVPGLLGLVTAEVIQNFR